MKEKPHDKMTKKFTFDKVFGPESKQVCFFFDAVKKISTVGKQCINHKYISWSISVGCL